MTLEEVRGRKLGADVLGCPPGGAVIVIDRLRVAHMGVATASGPLGLAAAEPPAAASHRLRGLEGTPRGFGHCGLGLHRLYVPGPVQAQRGGTRLQRAMLSMHLLYAHHFILGVYRLEELTPESEKSKSGLIQIYCEATGKLEARPSSELGP